MIEDELALFKRLQGDVRKAISNYVDPSRLTPLSKPLGHPKPDEFFNERLDSMREHLIAPHWINVERRDTIEECSAEIPKIIRCVALTRPDADLILAYSPQDDEYLLAQERGDLFGTIGIRGDAVGCYVAM